MTERVQMAYNVFRGGFRGDHPNTPPHWDDLPPWVRDAVTVAYLQGQLDWRLPAPATDGESSIATEKEGK